MRRGDKQVKKSTKPPSQRRDRAETIRQLRASEERYRNLFENATDAIVTFTLKGILTSANRQTERLLGRFREEIVGQPYQKFLTPASAARAAERTRRALAGEQLPAIFEGEVVCKDGGTVPIESRARFIRDAEGNPIGIQGIYRDVSERKRAEELLQESEKRFRALIENSMDAIALFAVDGTVLYRSPAATRTFGYTDDEVVGRSAFELMHPVDVERAIALLPQLLQTPGASIKTELRGRHKDGSYRWMEVVATNLLTEPSVRAIVGNYRDITERKQAEERLQDYAERLQAFSHRLIEVQETERRTIARELHDEVGQVLTGLRLTLETSLRLPTDAARGRLAEALTLANELITRVRELALDLRPAMLDDLGLLPALLWLCERYTAQTQVRVNFTHTGMATRFPPEVETAAYRIVQETLTNVARHAGVSEATVRLWTNQNQLEIEIHDRGRGFDPDSVLTASASSGLAGMRERAVLLGGHFTVESSPGNGTRVTARLPLIVYG